MFFNNLLFVGGDHTLDNITANVPTAYTLEGETEAVELSETSITQQQQKYYTLGGVRLKFTLPENTLEGSEITANPKFEWKISAAGKLCTDFKYTADGSECETLAADTVFDKSHAKLKTDYEFYWEPEKWDNTLDAQGTLTITFDNEDLPKKELAFKLEQRVLNSTFTAANPSGPGSDVRMLESMLWHLGLSPSGNPGDSGVRISEQRSEQYYDGNNSVGKMVGRFNYFNFSYITPDGKVGLQNIDNTNVTLDSLQKLKQHWIHYKSAYDNLQEIETYKLLERDQASLDKAETIFDGGDFTYPNDRKHHFYTSSYKFFPTYTKDVHKKVTEYKAFNRSDIFKAMISKEASLKHWGSSSPHRMLVGGADELGSKGFNQIQNAFTYGARSSQGNLRDGARCYHVSAYTKDDSGALSAINHYDPSINIMAMAAFAAGKPGDCGRSFYKAFVNHPENPLASRDPKNPSVSYTATHQQEGAIIRGMKTGTVNETITGTYKDDTYDQLKKAIGAYNQGQGIFDTSTSWSELLLTETYKPAANKKDKTVVTAMKYAMEILQNPARGIGLPKRTYIWEGGNYPADLTDEAGNPDPKAGTEWCFAYGEEEWINPEVHPLTKVKLNWQGYKDLATAISTRRISCE